MGSSRSRSPEVLAGESPSASFRLASNRQAVDYRRPTSSSTMSIGKGRCSNQALAPNQALDRAVRGDALPRRSEHHQVVRRRRRSPTSSRAGASSGEDRFKLGASGQLQAVQVLEEGLAADQQLAYWRAPDRQARPGRLPRCRKVAGWARCLWIAGFGLRRIGRLSKTGADE